MAPNGSTVESRSRHLAQVVQELGLSSGYSHKASGDRPVGNEAGQWHGCGPLGFLKADGFTFPA